MSNLVIGGTGSLGEAFIRKAIENQSQVTCFSRCELKQKELDAKLKSPFVKYVIGDIRDKSSLLRAMRGHDRVFHFAALKHVDTLEYFPEESVKTNVLGTMNALDAAAECGVKSFVFSSTDKATDPINSYGYSKALAEKIVIAHPGNFNRKNLKWGNVASSRGSVIPIFINSIREGRTVKITDLEMTRFWIHIRSAVDFVWEKMDSPSGTYIPPIKSAKVVDVVSALGEILGVTVKIEVVGIRPGEKIHERLISGTLPECLDSSDPKHTFTSEELKDFLMPLVGTV